MWSLSGKDSRTSARGQKRSEPALGGGERKSPSASVSGRFMGGGLPRARVGNVQTGIDDPAAINSALQAALAAIDPQVISAANAIFDDKLGSPGHSGQRPSRFRLLLDAMAGPEACSERAQLEVGLGQPQW